MFWVIRRPWARGPPLRSATDALTTLNLKCRGSLRLLNGEVWHRSRLLTIALLRSLCYVFEIFMIQVLQNGFVSARKTFEKMIPFRSKELIQNDWQKLHFKWYIDTQRQFFFHQTLYWHFVICSQFAYNHHFRKCIRING